MSTRIEALLRMSAPGGARAVARRLLQAAAGTCPRLHAAMHASDVFLRDASPRRIRAAGDREALHDFRVSLRRLRTALRFYRPFLGGRLAKSDLRSLKRIASSTGAGRDAEVQIAHLKEFEAALAASRRHSVAWLRARIASTADPVGILEAKRAFLALEARLRPSLARRPTLAESAQESRGPSFGRAAGDMLLSTASRLQRDLAAVRSAHDSKRAHRARISGKRLRYLMEPLAGRSAAWGRALKQLKGLQDVLGELHDMHVLSRQIASAAEQHAVDCVRRRLAASPAPRALTRRAKDPVPGLVRLARRVRRRELALFRRLGRSWGEVRKARFFGSLFSLAEGIR